MKRFFHFLLFVALLCIAVGSLQVWKEQRAGSFDRLSQKIHDIFNGRTLTRHPEKYTLAAGPRVDLKDVDVLAAMSRQRILLARAVVPSVVSITTSKLVQAQEAQNDPFYHFFRRYNRGGQNNGVQLQRELGSGAIVSKEGHIVTNHHVIEGTSDIEVKLSDDRTRKATLIGTDPDTDIAVLKIDATGLVPLPLGDSEAVEVGETVMAVGNPYGLEESVTQGIVSAKGRRGSENTSDLFQTDAAINPGNSGGPLINVRGELIGINEAIFSKSGGWQGVGFAIPSNTVRRSMDAILSTGRVLHGYLGIQRAMTKGPGVLVTGIIPGSPAEKAAIRPGDVIKRFNQREINDFDDLLRGVANVSVDMTVPIELLRDGKAVAVSARITEKPADFAQRAPTLRLPPGHPPVGPGGFGGDGSAGIEGILSAVQVRELAKPDLRNLDLPDTTRGVLVAKTEPNTVASEKFQPGDVIEMVNQERVANPGEFYKVIRNVPTDEPVVLAIIRGRARTLVVLNPGE